MMEIYTITAILDQINMIVNQYFEIDIQDNYDYDRFTTHCRFFVQRVVNDEYLEKRPFANMEIYQIMKQQSPRQYDCINEIADMIKKKYNYEVNDEEKLYLLIHLNKLTNK